MPSQRWGPCWALGVPHPPPANPRVMLSLSPDGAPSLPKSFAGVGTCPTPAHSCWEHETSAQKSGEKDGQISCTPRPKSRDGDCCWLGGAAQIYEVAQFFHCLLLLCFPSLFFKTHMAVGGGQVEGMENLKLSIHLF